MKSTLLNNWILRPFFYWFATIALFILRWKTKGTQPDMKKYVIIAAPHSSNWDFVFFLLIIFKFQMPVHWMGKHTMFKRPFRGLLKRLGGIPIDRTQKGNVVQSMVSAFHRSKELIVTIAPSGTREKVMTWKTGFYHIASQAGVPIVCGFIDYRKKIIGIGPTFSPTGDMNADMKSIQSFYAPFAGKYMEAPF